MIVGADAYGLMYRITHHGVADPYPTVDYMLELLLDQSLTHRRYVIHKELAIQMVILMLHHTSRKAREL